MTKKKAKKAPKKVPDYLEQRIKAKAEKQRLIRRERIEARRVHD